ncbi:hypothetical protein CTI12_AA204840 [Artemisia annua]|uniref:CG-1 domain-containing protein n=1 Tax=Artemisia annua TaxID=35608 RepID=A0A2U1P1G6_ARTAN|nr:hypothetical protein CTI12_AA204840 [Artemisia annua]
MADAVEKTNIANHQLLLGLNQIQQEALHRWLRPAEICEILTNYDKFELTPTPACRPPAGSLYLYDRKQLRYFRKDGHNWRKKDGKGVKEAHEKLKVGSVEVLHCYYVHGEDNENFQRRCYWLLDKKLENIVLVHYRDVKEGCKLGVPRVLSVDPPNLLQSNEQTIAPDQTQHPSHDLVQRNQQLMTSSDVGTYSLEQSISGIRGVGITCIGCCYGAEIPEVTISPDPCSSMWTSIHGSLKNITTADFLSHKLTDARLDADSHSQDFFSSGNGLFPAAEQLRAGTEAIYASKNDEAGGELKKVDSFGRWMDKEMGGDCEDSLMASNSGNYWDALEMEKDQTEVSSLSHHIQLNMDSVGPSLAKEQLFSICDFAPDWAYSGTETKVLITGNFLGDKNRITGSKWCCMFGETEVVAEFVTENAIRCQVPLCGAGRVPFYITSNNRIACSEVREFEYVQKPSTIAAANATCGEDEFGLLIRLSKLLSSGAEWKWSGCSVVNCEKCKLKDLFHSLLADKERCWKRITEVFKGNCQELLIQNLLKDKLYDQLLYEAHEGCQGLRMLDERGQGIIHLVAALGYEWAISPVVAAGMSPNFRDAHGRTALHWASLYGREETVIALVKLGAFAGAVDDPTPLNPGGQTASDLASFNGYKGIAGYLAEEDLMSHPSALSGKHKNGSRSREEEQESLAVAAVRRSALAAALIQDGFRARTFRQRKVTTAINEFADAEQVVALACCSHKLLYEAHEGCQGLRMLDERGQGIIHLVAALGYEWAISPVVAAGMSPNFRDAHGRTALHWASLYGREETVIALVKLGAFAGAVDDPTPLNPGGQTASDLASFNGYKGIAGYLAEEDLMSHPSALSGKHKNGSRSREEEQESLAVAAVRRSALAAALIQDGFRARTFRQRKVTTAINEFADAEQVVALACCSHKVQKSSHYEDYLHVAASRIQQKYLGWKGKNDFKKIRERIVKIQAHYRGHQVRKHYKKVVWSVGIVEKAILRWRRKSHGLRGFRPELTSVGVNSIRAGEYDFLQIGQKQKYAGVEKALARVKSMARQPQAEEQYTRMVHMFEQV